MAFDPIKILHAYSDTECSVQMWLTDAKSVLFASLPAAVAHARDNGGKWNDVEITVHLPREDIAYGTDKTRVLIDALERTSRRTASDGSDRRV